MMSSIVIERSWQLFVSVFVKYSDFLEEKTQFLTLQSHKIQLEQVLEEHYNTLNIPQFPEEKLGSESILCKTYIKPT